MDMKFIKSLVCAAILALGGAGAAAQTEVSPVDRFKPSDGVFMDIAVDMAKESVAKGGQPGGATIILNGAFHSCGSGELPEIEALKKAHAPSLANAVVYTVNEPVTEAWIALSKRGVTQIYFVNSKDDAISAGVYEAAAYDEAGLPQDGAMTPKSQIAYPSASALIKK